MPAVLLIHLCIQCFLLSPPIASVTTSTLQVLDPCRFFTSVGPRITPKGFASVVVGLFSLGSRHRHSFDLTWTKSKVIWISITSSLWGEGSRDRSAHLPETAHTSKITCPLHLCGGRMIRGHSNAAALVRFALLAGVNSESESGG
jgi:hypothetical protein